MSFEDAADDQQQLIADVIRALPMRLRRVFVMARVRRTSQRKIAAELQRTARQVHGHLWRPLVACRGGSHAGTPR